jgi:hypothetical protein
MNKFTLYFYGIVILIFIFVFISTCNELNNSQIETFQNNENLNYTIVMFMTGGICEEAHNCIKTLENINLKDKIKVYTLDKKADECIKKLNVETKFNNNVNLELSSKIREKGFQQITYEKFNSIEDCLKTTNNTVVYTDCDIVFFNSIESDIIEFVNSDYDMMFQCDNDNFDENCKNLCTGFMFLKPTKNTFNCLRKAKEIMKEDMKKGNVTLHDQTALNKAIKHINIKYGILDPTKYPNGARYFKSKNVNSEVNDIYKNYTPIILHNNFISGSENKKHRFQNSKMWYI